MNEKNNTFELMEPTSPEVLIPNSQIEPWMLIVASAFLVGLLAILFLRKKSAPAVNPTAVRETARAEASTALDAIGPVQPREAAVLSSLVLRKYLSVAAGDPALFETHEEYISRDKALADFSDEARESAAAGFTKLAAIKYSAATPEMETGEVVEDSRRLLEILHQGFKV